MIPKIQYDYFNKGNFTLPKEAKEPIKAIPGITGQSLISIWNIKKVFPNSIAEYFIKDKERIAHFN